jgi:hypothetical protein
MSNLGRFAGQIFIDGTFGNASGRFQGVVFPDGTIGDASGRFIGQVFEDGTIGDASGRFIGQIFEDGTIGDASGRLVGQVSPEGSFGGVGLGDLLGSQGGRPRQQTTSTGNVLISRIPKSTGSLYSVKVSADGQPQGQLSQRGQLRFWLSPGRHIIKVSGGGLWKSLEVVVSESGPLRLQTYFSNWGLLGGGLKLKQV